MTSLVKMITNHPNILRNQLIERARLERLIEKLEAEDDSELDANENIDEIEQENGNYKPNFEGDRKVIRLDAKIKKEEIKLQEAEGIASQSHKSVSPKATVAEMKSVEDTDKNVIKIREKLVDLREEYKLLSIDAKEGEWIRRYELKEAHEQKPNREPTSQEKELEQARLDLEKINADIEALESQFEGYKLLVAMNVAEI